MGNISINKSIKINSEELAKMVIAQIRTGTYEDWVLKISAAMTEYSSIGEREAREQVINELVGWMEEQRLPHNYKSQVYSTLTYCITHAKSLLNQQGAVEKTYGEKLIDAIEKLERMGLWEEWKEENPSKVNALKKLINEKSNQQGEEAKCPQHWAFNYFDDTLNQALCSYCKKPK